MKKFFFSLTLIFFIFFNSQPSFSFDFAPEIGDPAPSFNLKGINSSIKKNKRY